MRFAVVVSRFNPEVTKGLLSGVRAVLRENELELDARDVFESPGAFELPIIAKRLAETGRYQGVICVGCVIKGDTAHFEFISLGATIGIQQAALQTGVPISFGVLTTYNEEQALARSREDLQNKGREAAHACYETAATLAAIGLATGRA